MKTAFVLGRVVVAAAIVAAIVAQLSQSHATWTAGGVTNFAISYLNFFSYFTIESNSGSVVVCLIGAWFLVARRGGPDPRWFTGLRVAVVTYMTVTGIVYNLLLRGIPLEPGATVPWSNEILHVVAPIWMLVDWFFAPGRSPLHWHAIWGVVAFPLVWVTYTLIRGPFTPNEIKGETHWYPYPFFDPNLSPNGYFSVALYVILIAAIIGLTAAGLIRVSRRFPLASAGSPVHR